MAEADTGGGVGTRCRLSPDDASDDTAAAQPPAPAPPPPAPGVLKYPPLTVQTPTADVAAAQVRCVGASQHSSTTTPPRRPACVLGPPESSLYSTFTPQTTTRRRAPAGR
eukprot:2859419-Prymnesium_polylepis.1